MSFRFNWPEFDSEFYNEAKSQLEAALNKGNKPKNIVDHITVKEMHMGTTPPDLEILEVGELTTDKFRGIFKLTYAGDAYIVLQTKVQANPMHVSRSELPRHTRPSVLAADKPLVVPMLLRISDLKLRGIVVLVVSKTKGVTLVFKNDPLEDIVISSTFDSITSVRGFLQSAIENQLRNLFQEDLPVLIHNLSLRHIQNEQEKLKKQEIEEMLRMKRLQKWEKMMGSVMSEPGIPLGGPPQVHTDLLSLPDDYDCKSLPTFSPVSSHVATPTNESFGLPFALQDFATQDFNNMLNMAGLAEKLQCDQDGPPSFSSGFAGSTASSAPSDYHLLGRHTPRRPGAMGFYNYPMSPLYTEYASIKSMHQSPNPFEDSAYDDRLSEEDTVDRVCSVNTSAISTHSSVIADIYGDDADAPWYIVEGLGLSSEETAVSEQSITFTQDLVLHPTTHPMAAKLAQLTCLHRTLSPFTPSIQNATHRSLPHTVTRKSPSVVNRPRKIPKRRVIRLQGFGSTTSSSGASSPMSV